MSRAKATEEIDTKLRAAVARRHESLMVGGRFVAITDAGRSIITRPTLATTAELVDGLVSDLRVLEAANTHLKRVFYGDERLRGLESALVDACDIADKLFDEAGVARLTGRPGFNHPRERIDHLRRFASCWAEDPAPAPGTDALTLIEDASAARIAAWLRACADEERMLSLDGDPDEHPEDATSDEEAVLRERADMIERGDWRKP